jgi:GNAT superfamily N-acetyltransferase
MRYVIKQVDINRPEIKKLLKELQKTCLPLDKALDPNKGYWWVVYFKGEPVAFAALNHSYQWDKTGYLMRAGVVLEHQGHGLQRRLIKVRERKARQLGWEYLVSDTHYNPASANNLIRCGFTMYEPRSPWGFKASCYWRKKLTSS